MQMNVTIPTDQKISIFMAKKSKCSRSFDFYCLIHAFKSLIFFPLTITIFEKVNEQNKLQNFKISKINSLLLIARF